MQSTFTGTSKHLPHAKIVALNLHIALNTLIGKWDPGCLGWILFFRKCGALVFQYLLKKRQYAFMTSIKTSTVLSTRHKETVLKLLPYANMDSADCFSFATSQYHRNILVWDYQHCKKGKLTFFDTIYDEYHHFAMGNLQNSDDFSGQLTITG